jgi:hypothetical protein
MTITSKGAAGTLRPPRAAAVAGVLFSLLLITGLGVVRFAADAEGAHPGSWLIDETRRNTFRFALNLLPFAGIAFLWFMGVLRDRLGDLEDQFFSTVFLGSGLLFVANLFGSAAVAGALLEEIANGRVHLPGSEGFHLGLRTAGYFLNVFAIKMAGVFMFSTSAIALRTAIFPRWVAFSGFGCGLVLLAVITNWPWIVMLFPLWVLLVSTQVLISNLLPPGNGN